MSERPEWEAIRNNLTDLTTSVTHNLQIFESELVRTNFIAKEAARDIIATQGIGDREKANRFLNSVSDKVDNRYGDLQNWFEKFLTIFKEKQINVELAKHVFSDYVKLKPSYDGSLRKLFPIEQTPTVARETPLTTGSDVPDTDAVDSPHQLCGYTKSFNLASTRGLAILVTCDYVNSGKQPLPATKKDAEEMETTFKEFKYDIHKLQNGDATKQGIMSALSSASKYLNTYSTSGDLESQVIIFAFSGHGSNKKGNELLYSNDGQEIQLEDEVIFPLVQEINVARIPKIFFIDACRGSDFLVSVSKGGGPPGEVLKSVKQCWEEKGVNHVQGNYRVYYATIPDHKAYASVDGSGSRWMPLMARALRDDVEDLSLADIATNVSRHVHNLPGDTKQQCDMITNRITTPPLHLQRMSGGFRETHNGGSFWGSFWNYCVCL